MDQIGYRNRNQEKRPPWHPRSNEKGHRQPNNVETVLDENNNNAEIAPFDHGAPADANKTPVAIASNAATMANANQVDVCVLCKMKHLGGWFNPTVLEYIACSQKSKKLEKINEEVNEDDTPEDATASRAGREVANAMLLHVVFNLPCIVLER